MHPVINYIDKLWPFAASVLVGAMTVGSLHSDINSIKDEQTRLRTDHDVVVELRQGQQDLKDSVRHLQDSVDRVEKKL
jgi:hypothetical protein